MDPTLRALALSMAALCLPACGDGGGRSRVAERGRQVYLSQCVQCHSPDPAQPGPVGPAVKGSSRELLDAKVLRGVYPPGYTPKRPTNVMPQQPVVEPEIQALAEYLR